MNDIRFLIHVTDSRNLKSIFRDKYLYPESLKKKSGQIIAPEFDETIYTIVTTNAPNMGLSFKNLEGVRQSVIIIDKSVLLDQKFQINLDWYRFDVDTKPYNTADNPLNGGRFKKIIQLIDKNFNQEDPIINSILLSEPISIGKYVLGVYEIYGSIYQDLCNVDYLLLMEKRSNNFVNQVDELYRPYLTRIYRLFHDYSKIVKKINPNIFFGVLQLNTSCSNYNIIGETR